MRAYLISGREKKSVSWDSQIEGCGIDLLCSFDTHVHSRIVELSCPKLRQ